MEVEQFLRRVRIAASANEVFLGHSRPGAFERLTPPWERARLLQSTGGIRDGARVVIEIQAGPLRRRWIEPVWAQESESDWTPQRIHMNTGG